MDDAEFFQDLIFSEFSSYSSNYITKKEPKSGDGYLKFEWHDLSPIFLAIMLLYKVKVC